MSSTSPFKKKDHLCIENLENFPKTFEELKYQTTYRTLLESDTHFMLDESRKTINSEMREEEAALRQSLKGNSIEDCAILKQKEAKIIKLEQSLFLEKGINQCLKEEIFRNKERINQLARQLQYADKNRANSGEQSAHKRPGILKNNMKRQYLPQNQTLRFGQSKSSKAPRADLELQNVRLRNHIQHLEDNLRQCKGLLLQVQQKSKHIQTQYEAEIRVLRLRNQYLEYQIPPLH